MGQFFSDCLFYFFPKEKTTHQCARDNVACGSPSPGALSVQVSFVMESVTSEFFNWLHNDPSIGHGTTNIQSWKIKSGDGGLAHKAVLFGREPPSHWKYGPVYRPYITLWWRCKDEQSTYLIDPLASHELTSVFVRIPAYNAWNVWLYSLRAPPILQRSAPCDALSFMQPPDVQVVSQLKIKFSFLSGFGIVKDVSNAKCSIRLCVPMRPNFLLHCTIAPPQTYYRSSGDKDTSKSCQRHYKPRERECVFWHASLETCLL